MTATYKEPPPCTLALKPCPDWCTLPPDHPWDSYDPDAGLWWRGHSGPKIAIGGVGVGGQETSDGRLTLDYWLENNDDLPLDELRKLGANILKAADWIEAHQ